MFTDSILRLKIAFANTPMKGLFFWEGLLFLKDEEYEKIVEENFISTMNSFPKKEKDVMAYYQKILGDLKQVRKEITEDPKIRNEVEKIREALISEAAQETIIEAMKENLAKQETQKE